MQGIKKVLQSSHRRNVIIDSLGRMGLSVNLNGFTGRLALAVEILEKKCGDTRIFSYHS